MYCLTKSKVKKTKISATKKLNVKLQKNTFLF